VRVRHARRVIAEGLSPDDLAGVLVERDHHAVERPEDGQVAVERRAAVDHIAARQDTLGQAMVVLPQLLSCPGVRREDAGVGGRREDLAVVDDRLRLLPALLFAAERQRPGGHQPLHVLRVDLVEGAEPVLVRAHPVRHDVPRRLRVVEDVGIRDAGSRGGHRQHEAAAYGQEWQHSGSTESPERCDETITPFDHSLIRMHTKALLDHPRVASTERGRCDRSRSLSL
jgi:hypothetical protein